MRHRSIPNILDTILRDATVYFVVIFACQLFPLFFLIIDSVSNPCCVRGNMTFACSSRLYFQARIKFTPRM